MVQGQLLIFFIGLWSSHCLALSLTEWLDEQLINVTLEGENAETKEIADVDLLLDNLVVRRLITGSSEHLNSLGKTWQQSATAR